MKNYVAQLENNIVTEVIVADLAFAQANVTGELYDLGPEPLTVGIGYTYDPVTDTFCAPPELKPIQS